MTDASFKSRVRIKLIAEFKAKHQRFNYTILSFLPKETNKHKSPLAFYWLQDLTFTSCNEGNDSKAGKQLLPLLPEQSFHERWHCHCLVIRNAPGDRRGRNFSYMYTDEQSMPSTVFFKCRGHSGHKPIMMDSPENEGPKSRDPPTPRRVCILSLPPPLLLNHEQSIFFLT